MFLHVLASLVTGSTVVAQELSCSEARGIFPEQGSNPQLLHWQADSSSLSRQGIPVVFFFSKEAFHSIS